MDMILFGGCLIVVVGLYFVNNPLKHGSWFIFRRFLNWFPLGMTYAFLYMGRYNLNVSKNALGTLMSKESFGIIFAVGTVTYAMAFLVNGPLVDRIGGKRGIIIGALGASLANVAMGVVTYLFLHGRLSVNLVVTLSILYAVNMYFQSYGAVSIIKVKAYWFHVRERGVFGAIFGTLISFGVYFAFDWGQAIVNATKATVTGTLGPVQRLIRTVFATEGSAVDATWLVFFIPAGILIVWILIDLWLIKDSPKDAKLEDFDTHDASSGEMDKDFSALDLLKRVFTNPIMIMIAIVELTSGVMRNGIMQWYFIFAKEVKQPGAEFFLNHWGLLLCFSGVIGGFLAGIVSDRFFHSRRGPASACMNVTMLVSAVVMAIALFYSPFIVGSAAILISLAVIGVHSLMSGTASADFGGRKATATASGIIDGFVYLGTGIQSFCLGYLTSWNWGYWPLFLIPFTILGLAFSLKLWKALPPATVRYLKEVENVDLSKPLPVIPAEPIVGADDILTEEPVSS